MGNLGLDLKFLHEETGPGTDPLSGKNILAAFTGSCTAMGVPTSGRHHPGTRSPLIDPFGGSNVGGSWAVACKCAGFDGIVVNGKMAPLVAGRYGKKPNPLPERKSAADSGILRKEICATVRLGSM
jgi:aldehyde:ferredoxin oxidoreductase